jgi:hypothetical protein
MVRCKFLALLRTLLCCCQGRHFLLTPAQNQRNSQPHHRNESTHKTLRTLLCLFRIKQSYSAHLLLQTIYTLHTHSNPRPQTIQEDKMSSSNILADRDINAVNTAAAQQACDARPEIKSMDYQREKLRLLQQSQYVLRICDCTVSAGLATR